MADGADALPTEIKTQFDNLQKIIHAQRETFDQQAKAGDAVLEAKIAKQDAAYDELKKSVNEEIAALKRGTQSRENDEGYKAAVEYALERASFDSYVRKGVMSLENDADAVKAAESIGLEKKTLSTIIAADGGYATVPERMSERMEIYLETSMIRQVARVQSIGTGSVELPVNRKGANAAWVSELTTRTATNTPTLNMQRFTAHEIYALPLVTRAVLEDADFDIEAWLEDEVTEAIELAENLAFVAGNGQGKPKGFTTYTKTAVASYDSNTNYGTHAFVATGTSADFSPSVPGASPSTASANGADALFDLIYAFKPVYRGALDWAMTRKTLGRTRKLKDGDGQYLFRDALTEQGIISQLLGYDVMEFEDMDEVAANSYSIALGDFNRGYMIVDRIGIEMLRDDKKYPGFVEFQFRRRTGGDCRDFDAIKFLKFGTS